MALVAMEKKNLMMKKQHMAEAAIRKKLGYEA
jgi:hypothetical protein